LNVEKPLERVERNMSKKDPEPEQPYKILKDKLIRKPETKPKESK